MQLQLAAVEDAEGTGKGNSSGLEVGDLVLVKKEPTQKREGPMRFQPRTHREVYQIQKKIGQHTFILSSIIDPQAEVPLLQPVNAERLILVDMPEMKLDPRQPRMVDIHEPDSDVWFRWKIDS